MISSKYANLLLLLTFITASLTLADDIQAHRQLHYLFFELFLNII